MFKLHYTKAFIKQYSNLPLALQRKTKQVLQQFQTNPKSPALRAHKLHGALADFYSFSVDYKTRVVFEIDKKAQAFVLLKIGDHDVYQ